MHQLTSKVDGGEVVKTQLCLTFRDLFACPEFDNLNNQMSETLLGDWIQELSSKSISSVGLSNDKSTDSEYWPRLSTQDNGWIDWSDH